MKNTFMGCSCPASSLLSCCSEQVFLVSLKLWQTSKLFYSQDFPHLLLKTGNIIGLPSLLVLLHFSREEGILLSVSWLFLTLFPLRTTRWTPSGCGDLLHLSFSSYSTTSSLETSICIKATLWFSLQSAFGTGISTLLSAADTMQEINLTPLLACWTLLTHRIWLCGDFCNVFVQSPG